MGLLYYERHFILLTCITAALAASGGWMRALGVVAAFSIYGALHASAVIVTVRSVEPPWRSLGFIASGALLSMLNGSWSLLAYRLSGSLPGMAKPALLLAASSGVGAAAYATLIRRCLAADLGAGAASRIAAGCVAATLAVLGSGLYRQGGVLWFAAAWWFAFSVGLWYHDRGRDPLR